MMKAIVKIGLLALFTLCGILILGRSTALAQQSKGESLLNKGDSIAVYVDKEDFEAIKAAKEGAHVKLKILDNVVRSQEKLINKSSAVFATLTKRSTGGMYAGGGNATLSVDSTYSNAKSMIPLNGTIELKGKSGIGKKVFAIVLFPIGWLIKGGDIEFPEGKNVYKPVVAKDTPVNYLR